MHSLVFYFFAFFLPAVWLQDQTALDEFVDLPDSNFNYSLVKRRILPYFTFRLKVDTLNMTSQKWLDESEVDKPVWSHKLTIAAPKKMKLKNSCLLIIKPNQNDELNLNDRFGRINVGGIVTATESIVAMLRPVPFQPLTFFNHPLGRKNITGWGILSYSWWRFIKDPTAPPHSLVQFPMVKATVRAMDTITEYVKKEYGIEITRFTLMGISLSGWVAWLTAAVDKRVEAIMPVAMDFLNIIENFHHQYRAYCGWSYLVKPFYKMNITQKLDKPRFRELASHVDTLAYNERYANVDKYIIVLSGDELFQPDNSHYYFSQLEGVKYLRILPNSDYRFQFQGKERFIDPIISFYFKIVNKQYRFPIVSWEIKRTNTSASIYVRTCNAYEVNSYHADITGTRRDFRMKRGGGKSPQDNPVKWIKTKVETVGRNYYKKEMSKPAKGWRGFFLEAVYVADKNNAQFTVTSEMVILLDTFPCRDCSGDGCRGKLI